MLSDNGYPDNDAAIYQKQDPKGTVRKLRWTTKFFVGHKRIFASLKLLAPDNRELAQARANQLRHECLNGRISVSTKSWLGERAYQRISALLSEIRAAGFASYHNMPGPACHGWLGAGDGYVEFCSAKDTKNTPEDKACDPERTKYSRRRAVIRFCEWAEWNEGPLGGRPITDVLLDWVAYRKRTPSKYRGDSKPISMSTIRTEIAWIAGFAKWLHRRRYFSDPLDLEIIKEVTPVRPSPMVQLPSVDQDVQFIRELRTGAREARRENIRRSMWPAWCLYLLVRGLGCRPSEAMGLTWSTIDLSAGTVRIHGKNRVDWRTVPVLFNWVYDGLKEIWNDQENPTRGAVCRNAYGAPWTNTSSPCLAIRMAGTMRLKQAQKLHIMQLIRMGFPAHVVAVWTGHSLSIQEKHYCEEDAYIPKDHDYGEFAELTELGKKCFDKVTQWGRWTL